MFQSIRQMQFTMASCIGHAINSFHETEPKANCLYTPFSEQAIQPNPIPSPTPFVI